MPEIQTLIPDIYKMLSSTDDAWFTEDIAKECAHETSIRLQGQFAGRNKAPTLRLSQMGPKCPKALWASIHAPDEAERLPPYARIKFAYGHQIEALILGLAKAAGHDVKGEQDELILDGIHGHRDCVIDGCVVDIKSASSRSYLKFKDGSIKNNDPFGYLEQLDGYLLASQSDPLVSVRDRGYLLAVDKQLGHVCLYEHHLREVHIRNRIATYKEIVSRDRAPDCTCDTVPDGKSGNIRLGTTASYSPYKHFCFPHLRTFLYASGPVYLSKVERKPDVIEVNRHGQIIYN